MKNTSSIAIEIIYNYIIPLKMANILQLAMGIVEFPKITWREEVLNKRQCENLLSNFQKGVQILHDITKDQIQVFHEAQKDLFRIVNKGRVLIEECCNDNWVDATVMQLNNREWFRELLSDFEFCFHTLCEISCHYNPLAKETILAFKDNTTFYPTPTNEVEKDQISICRRLSKQLEMCNTKDCKDCRLAGYLEQYLKSLQRVEGGELDNIVFPYNSPRPEYGTPPHIVAGNRYGVAVYMTNWLGVKCATKVIRLGCHEDAYKYWKEASILGGLSHPNIIKFLCCDYQKASMQFELVMEFGERTLLEHLNAQGRLKEMDAVDIMLQIANGMCYLHDMKVAHRDLKPENVVVAPSKDSQLVNLECIDVKLLDFGVSKVDVKHSPEVPTGRNIGTCGYMAPEAMAKELSEVDALKADVFSFGMMCSDILSGKKCKFLKVCEYSEYIHECKRPILPKTYSEVLRSLVHECWSPNPSKRPTFLEIHKRLATLKNAMLKGSLEITGITNDTTGSFRQFFSSSERISKCMQWLGLVPQLDHFDNSTSIPSAQANCYDSSSYRLFMEVSTLLKL